MNKTNKSKALMPKLRFPEFQGTDKWSLTTIGEIGSFYYGKSAPKWSLKDDAPTLCVRYGELYTKFETIISSVFSRTVINPKNLRFSRGGEVLVPRVGEKPEDFGKHCCYLPLKNIAIGEMISVFETKEIPLFYTFYFRNLYKQFARVVEGQNVKNLYYKELEPLKICRPSRKEQQKIADCLSSLDELITTQSQKIETLKQHKKGLMQNLFPVEGQTTPKLRFPELQNTGEWKEKKLGDCFKNTGGTALEKYVVDTGDYHFISIGNYSTDGKYIDKGQRIKINDITKTKLLNKDDLVMVLNDKTASGDIIGSTIHIKECNKYIYNQRSERLIINSKLLPTFSWFILNSKTVRKEIYRKSQGGTQIYVNFSNIKTISILIPEIKEQQKIADCLSSLDELITTQSQKIETLKQHKKGLMQQLFPNLEAINE